MVVGQAELNVRKLDTPAILYILNYFCRLSVSKWEQHVFYKSATSQHVYTCTVCTVLLCTLSPNCKAFCFDVHRVIFAILAVKTYSAN